MGTSTSLKQAAGKVNEVASAFDGRALRAIAERIGRKTKPIAAAAIEPNTLSHWGRGARRGGHKVQARYKVTGDGTVELTPTVAPLAALLEKGSGTTWHAPKRRGSKRRKRGTVSTYQRARVPARGAWSKAKPPVAHAAPRVVDDAVEEQLRRIF